MKVGKGKEDRLGLLSSKVLSQILHSSRSAIPQRNAIYRVSDGWHCHMGQFDIFSVFYVFLKSVFKMIVVIVFITLKLILKISKIAFLNFSINYLNKRLCLKFGCQYLWWLFFSRKSTFRIWNSVLCVSFAGCRRRR